MDWYIGSHHAREEGAVLVLTLVGELSLQDVKQIITALDRLIERHGHYGTLIDMEKLGTFRPDARRLIGEWPGYRTCYGNALYGGSITARALMTLTVRAIQLFSGQASPVGFFQTKEEARTWLAAQGPSPGRAV